MFAPLLDELAEVGVHLTSTVITVNQVWLIKRYITDPTGRPYSAVAALGVTNSPPTPDLERP
jgi:hypothetical protein